MDLNFTDISSTLTSQEEFFLISLNGTIDTHQGDIGTVQKCNLNRLRIQYSMPGAEKIFIRNPFYKNDF